MRNEKVCKEKRLTGTFYRGAVEGLGNKDIVAAIGAIRGSLQSLPHETVCPRQRQTILGHRLSQCTVLSELTILVKQGQL